jgi:hypothetical protein
MLKSLLRALRSPSGHDSAPPIFTTIESFNSPEHKAVPLDVVFSPTVGTFERFGMCGTCTICCKRGVIKLMDLTPEDQIITRNHGWMSPLSILKYSGPDDAQHIPKATLVEKGCMGGGLPHTDLAFGAGNSIKRYVVTQPQKRPQPVSLQLASNQDHPALQDCSIEELCIPILSKHVEILIEGIYVMCADVSDVTKPVGRPN